MQRTIIQPICASRIVDGRRVDIVLDGDEYFIEGRNVMRRVSPYCISTVGTTEQWGVQDVDAPRVVRFSR